ncbi:MAG TPA: hypothetical protein VFQ85_12865 [Mycobacteriales bacterium]|jgi:hypothetical protein|nr:hypothetical protein [Mycobacteriales bacterium]
MRLQGPRQRIRRSRVAVVSAVLVVTTAIIFVHDFVGRTGSVRDFFSWDHEWLGAGVAATLLFGAVTIYITRRHFASNHYPYIVYERGRRRPENDAGPLVGGEQELWCVVVTNLGGGLAILDRVSYDVELVDKPDSARRDVGFDEMLAVLQSPGYRDERDFRVKNWQPGFAFLNGPFPRRMWEFPLPVARRIKTLTVRLDYSSRVGDTDRLTIDLIPPRGLPEG